MSGPPRLKRITAVLGKAEIFEVGLNCDGTLKAGRVGGNNAQKKNPQSGKVGEAFGGCRI